MSAPSSGQGRSVLFICWGNICRSPMAERVARRIAEDESIPAVFDSAGISDEEDGCPMDPRAARVLIRSGYNPTGHRARQVTPDELRAADLVVAAEPAHVRMLRTLAPDGSYALLNDFNPRLPTGTPLRDPWYGSLEGFVSTLQDIEVAMPGLFAEILRLATDCRQLARHSWGISGFPAARWRDLAHPSKSDHIAKPESKPKRC